MKDQHLVPKMASCATGLNTALLDALGVQWKDKGIIGATLRLRAGRPPTLTLHHLLTNKTKIGEVVERFELTPIKKPSQQKTA